MSMKKNIAKAMYEITTKAQMQQSIYDAITCLDGWDWGKHKDCLETIIDELQNEAQKIGNEIEEFQYFVNGGSVDLDEALEKSMEYEED